MRDTGKGEKKREKINMAISRRYPRRRKKRKGIPLRPWVCLYQR